MQAKTSCRKGSIRLCPQPNLKVGLTPRDRSYAAPAAAVPVTDAIFDHPDIGGKFTICVLLYGPGST